MVNVARETRTLRSAAVIGRSLCRQSASRGGDRWAFAIVYRCFRFRRWSKLDTCIRPDASRVSIYRTALRGPVAILRPNTVSAGRPVDCLALDLI